MGSIQAKAVAKEVLETIGKGKRLNLGKIALRNGYSKATAKNPQQIKRTKSFQEAISPLVSELEEERYRVLEQMKKQRSKAKYRDLVDALDKLTKNIQLLGGKETDRNYHTISWILDEIERKNRVE